MLEKALQLAISEEMVLEEHSIKLLIAQMHVVKDQLDVASEKLQDLINEDPRVFRPHLCQTLEESVDGGQGTISHQVFLEDFLNLSGDASDGSFHGEKNALAFAEQMEFQFLSEQLRFAITDNEDSPRLDDIYGTPLQLSSLPVSSCSNQGLQNIGSPVKVQLSSSRLSSGSATTNKARLRWTLELHEAVNKLEGPEN